jgi:UDP-3-O-acyl N-acetylglucosamine deacetylase
VRFLPLESGSEAGIRFRSANGDEATVDANSVVDTRRCTVVEACGRRLSTTEHLLSALNGVGITDVVVEFYGPEVPILDGSAVGFVRELRAAGVRDLSESLDPVIVHEPIDVIGQNGERMIAAPADHFSLVVVLDYPNRRAIGTQAAMYERGSDYERDIAPARTYGFLSELDKMLALGLAGGASLDNCIALDDDGRADPRTPLRFANELARHKLLDVIGDLMLIGRPIQAQVVALRPSHAVNSALARKLSAID